jgi:hypothetical protein
VPSLFSSRFHRGTRLASNVSRASVPTNDVRLSIGRTFPCRNGNSARAICRLLGTFDDAMRVHAPPAQSPTTFQSTRRLMW